MKCVKKLSKICRGKLLLSSIGENGKKNPIFTLQFWKEKVPLTFLFGICIHCLVKIHMTECEWDVPLHNWIIHSDHFIMTMVKWGE
jgi:hypothetical protein